MPQREDSEIVWACCRRHGQTACGAAAWLVVACKTEPPGGAHGHRIEGLVVQHEWEWQCDQRAAVHTVIAYVVSTGHDRITGRCYDVLASPALCALDDCPTPSGARRIVSQRSHASITTATSTRRGDWRRGKNDSSDQDEQSKESAQVQKPAFVETTAGSSGHGTSSCARDVMSELSNLFLLHLGNLRARC